MAVIGTIRRNRQPQRRVPIDRSNKFAKNLKGLFTQTGTGRLFDHVNQVFPSVDTSTERIFNDGLGRDYLDQDTQFANRQNYGLVSALTIVAIIDVDALTNYSAVVSCADTPTTNGWELRLGEGSGDSRILFHRANSGERQTRSGTANLIAAGEKNVFIAITCADSLVETMPYFKVNGYYAVGVSSSGVATGSQTASVDPLYIGRREDAITKLDGGVKYVALFDRAFSNQELEEIRSNPWQLLSRVDDTIYANVAAAGGTFKPYWIRRPSSIGTGVI